MNSNFVPNAAADGGRRIVIPFLRVARALRPVAGVSLAALFGIALMGQADAAVSSTVALADSPVFGSNTVPGNIAFALSVEFPTAVSVANLGDYNDATIYLGYFDPAKCYKYIYNGGATPTAADDVYSYAVAENSYFQPYAFAAGSNGHSCTGLWSGNFMNWATMQTVDPFRWVLTGGLRTTDFGAGNYPQTVLEKAWGASEGSTNNFPYRGVDQASNPNSTTLTGNHISLSTVSSVTPLTNWTDFNTAIWGNGNAMLLSGVNGGGYNASAFNGFDAYHGSLTNVYDMPTNVNSAAPTPGYAFNGSTQSVAPNTAGNLATYRLYIRVSVCDTSILGVAGLESNCVGYGTANASGVYPIYKPQGLIQQYANQIKYSVFSYLNTSNESVQGAALREPMEFVGPTSPVPLSSNTTTNPNAEWFSDTGVMKTNPDTTSASGSGVSNSGVMNYLNKFGQYGALQYLAGNSNYIDNTQVYMTFDHVSELYYAAVRYYENLGNVPQWLPQSVTYNAPTYTIPAAADGQIGLTEPTSVQLDNFPAVSTWTDPIAYRCQKNFIVGIGDDHTWTDYNVGGSTQFSQDIGNHYPAPSAVAGDTFNQANAWLYELETLEGLTQTPWWASPGNNPSGSFGAGNAGSTLYMAGLAYGTHVLDIRPDLTDTQTISTYWMDVAEDQRVEYENMFFLAAKYGGFTVPSTYLISNTTPLTQAQYDLNGATITMSGNHTVLKPSNYFEANNATAMVTSLTNAFQNISAALTPSVTDFSVANPNAVLAGSYSFSSSYSPSSWTGSVQGSTITFATGDTSYTPVPNQIWTTDTTLNAQVAGTGWQTNRNVVTWSNGSTCGSTYAGAPFEVARLCASTQLNALANPSYSPNTTSTQYLDYLRGDATNQVGTSGGTQSLRARTLFLGDIVDAALVPVANPAMAYNEGSNPGYTAFKTAYLNRPAMVYAAANDGMLHGFLGSSGVEVFAYVPNALFQGPTGTPQVNGLAQLGNPNYSHHYYVDATPVTADLDLGRTGGTTGTPNWATVVIGGLGKGGTSFYAINVTDPASMESASEAAIAHNVMWEYTDSTMGYSFATPVVAKVAQYGWVVLLTSGYDNSDGYGYLYIVNPATGALLQKIRTPSPSSGMTRVSAFTENYTDYTAESAYVGDLNGQVWRFDLRATSGTYPTPTLLAQLTDANGNPQPVTSAPDVEISPTTAKRYVLLGTGKLLNTTDVSTTTTQTFYSIIDGNANLFNQALTSPITRAAMTAVSNDTTTVTIPSSSMGLYYDLSAGYRVITMPISFDGVVAFSAVLPTSTDPCNPEGSSEVFAANFATGESVINTTTTAANGTTSTTTQPFVSFTNQVTTLAFLNNNGSGVELVAGDSKNNIGVVPTTEASLATRILNWREIPTPE
jgi:type IV pilus assembly protein PilY1